MTQTLFAEDFSAAQRQIIATGSHIGQRLTRPEARARIPAATLSRFNARNIMAPEIIEYCHLAGVGHGPLVAEITTGMGIPDRHGRADRPVGVTVYHVLPHAVEADPAASECVFTAEALAERLHKLNGKD